MGPAVKFNTIPNHDIGYTTNVAMHIVTVQQSLTKVSPNLNLKIVMLQADAGNVSKNNVIPFRCPCPPFISPLVAQTYVAFSQK
ncbi:hypothetical protein TNCV_4192551 [Trichonephila clavipes]|nr:hypothetical protein TNCV_4192551 [Trichonephila clavipes]